MPRQGRIQYPGAVYHVMSRGERREDIVLDDVDRQDFLKTLAEGCQKTDWQVHAYCLMRNHYHLVLETPNANLVAGMAWLQSSYTTRLNHRHKLIGHVLSGRDKAQLVEGSGKGYLRAACDYVHLNPARAGLLQPEERLLGYPWGSLGYYLAAPEHRPKWMRVDRLLGEHGLTQDTAAARQEFERHLEARRLEPGDQERLRALRRGWCLGTQGFKNRCWSGQKASWANTISGRCARRALKPRPSGSSARSWGVGAGGRPTWRRGERATRGSWRLRRACGEGRR